jgi:uncharacterized protein
MEAMTLGKVKTLKVLRKTVHGAFLAINDGEEVLLPQKFVKQSLNTGDNIDVFIYTDSEDRIVATTHNPKIKLNEFAVLEVTDLNKYGAFLDWGLEKDLFLPYGEQEMRVNIGDKVVVSLCHDEQTDRLFASAKIGRLTKETPSFKKSEEVDLLIGRKSELGYQVIINNRHIGLLFFNKIFQKVKIGDRLKGYIDQVREDGKIDVGLRKHGYDQVIDAQEIVLSKLNEYKGALPFTDKSDPKAIQNAFNMSKSTFKKSVGALYKQGKIRIEADRIVLCR